jgi:hypothetical protein
MTKDLDQKIIELMDLFDDEQVTTADKIDRPQQALDREAYSDFMKRNPMAGGGMLVQPGFGGTRQGYATSSVKTKKFKYPVSNQFGTFYSDKKPEVSKAVVKQEEKTKFINQLVSDANAGDKHVSISEIGEKVKKKFKLKNAKSINITSFPSLELLESRADKIDKVLRDMLISDKPLNGFWHNVISERTGVPINKPGNLRILEQSPTYTSIKDQGLDLLKINYSRKSFNYLHDFSLSDQLSKALEISKGNPTYIGLGGEKLRTALPSNKIMEFALRSWNTNKGSKDGPVQFFNKNGKPITWQKGIKLPYKNVSFSYNGKMHKKSDLNTDYMKKFFPEVYNNQIAINNLSVTKVDNPFKKGSKISVKDLVKKIQVDNYKWSPRFPTLEILHGKKGVATEPFSNLTYATRDINQLENSINASLKAGNIKPAEANRLIKTVRSTISGKTGDDLREAIISRQLNLAKQKGLTFPKMKEMGMDEFKKTVDFLTNQESSILKKIQGYSKLKQCKVDVAAASGGRIGFKFSDECIRDGLKEQKIEAQKGNKKAAQELVQIGKVATRAGLLKNLLGPGAILGEAVFEGAIIGNKVLGGKPADIAYAESYLSYLDPRKYSGQLDPLKMEREDMLQSTADKNILRSGFAAQDQLSAFNKAIQDRDLAKARGRIDQYNPVAADVREQARFADQSADIISSEAFKDASNVAQEYLQGQSGQQQADLGVLSVPQGEDADNLRRLKANKAMKNLYTQYSDDELKNYLKQALGTDDDEIVNRYLDLTRDTKRIVPSIARTLSGLDVLRSDAQEQEAMQNLMGGAANFAGGGIAKLAGVSSGPPPESGLNPQGLQGLLKRGIKI